MTNRLYQIEQISGNTIQFSGDSGTVWYAITHNIHVEPTSGVIDESGVVQLEIIGAEFIDAYGSITIHSDYCKPLFLDNVSYFSEYPKRRIEIVYLDKNHTESSVTITTNDSFIYEYSKHDGFILSENASSLTFTFANETDYETREWVYTSTRHTRLFVDILVISRPSGSEIDCSDDKIECSIDSNITLTYNEPSCAANAYALYDGYRYIPFTISEECGINSVFTFSQDASIITFSVKEDVLANSSITSATCLFSVDSEVCDCGGDIIVNYNRYGGDEDDDVYGSIVFTVLDNTTSAIVTNITASISLNGNSGKYKYRTNFVDGVAIFKKVRYDASGYTYDVTIGDAEYVFEALSSITTPCSGISGTVSPTDFVKSNKVSYSVVGDENQVDSPIYETIRKNIFVEYTTIDVDWSVNQWSDPTLSSVTNGIEYSYNDFNTLGYDVYDTATLQQDESMLIAQLPFIHEASAYTITLSSRSINESALTSVEVFNGIVPTKCDNKYGELNDYDSDVTLVFTNGTYYVVVDYVPDDDPFGNWEREETLEISYEEQIINLNNVGFLSDYTEFTIQTSGVTSTTARINNSGVTVYAEAVGDGPYPLTYRYEKDCENDWVIENNFNLKVSENITNDDILCDINYTAYSSLTIFDQTTIVPYNGVIHVKQAHRGMSCKCSDIVFSNPTFVDETYTWNLQTFESAVTAVTYTIENMVCGIPQFTIVNGNNFIHLSDDPTDNSCEIIVDENLTNTNRSGSVQITYGEDCVYTININQPKHEECTKECNGVTVNSAEFLPNPVPYEGTNNGTLRVVFKVNFICGDEESYNLVTHEFGNIVISQNPSLSAETYNAIYHVDDYATDTNPSCHFSGDIPYSYTQNGRGGTCEWILDNCELDDLYCVPNQLYCSGGSASIYASSVTYNYISNGFCEQETSSVTEPNVFLTSVTYTANSTDEVRTYTLNLTGTTAKGCSLEDMSLITTQEACCLGCNSIRNFTCLTIPKSGGTNILVATYNLAVVCDINDITVTIKPSIETEYDPLDYSIVSYDNGTIYASIPANLHDNDVQWIIKMFYKGSECANASGTSTQNCGISTTNISMPLFLQMNDNFSGVVNSGVTTIFVPLGFLETDLDSATLTVEQVVNHPNFVILKPLTKYLFDYIGESACTIDSGSSFYNSVFKYRQHFTTDCDITWTDTDTVMATYDYLSDYPQKHMGGFVDHQGTIRFTGTAESNLDEIMRQDQLYRDAVSFAETFAEDNTIDRSNQPFVITRNNKKVYIVYKQGTSLYCGDGRCQEILDIPYCSEITNESDSKKCCVNFVDYNYGENKNYCDCSDRGGYYDWQNANDNKQTFVLSTRPIFYNPMKSRYEWSFSTTFNTIDETETLVPYDNNFPSISNNDLDGLSGNSEKPITLFRHTASTIYGGFYPFVNELQTNRNINGSTNMFPLKTGWQTLSFTNWYHDIDMQTATPNMEKISDEMMLFGFVDDTIMKEFIIEVVDENDNHLIISALYFSFTDYTNVPNDDFYLYDPPSTSVTANLPLFKTTMGSPVIEGEDTHGDGYRIEGGDPNYVYLTPKVKKLLIHVNLDDGETTSIDVIEEN